MEGDYPSPPSLRRPPGSRLAPGRSEAPGGSPRRIWIACASRGIAVLTVPLSPPTAGPELATVSPRALVASPNPFAERTEIAFTVPLAGRTTVKIYDVTGRLVRTVVDRIAPAGPGAASWDGRDGRGRAVSPGVYLVRYESGRDAATEKVVRVH